MIGPSDAELAQVMIHVPVAPHQPIALAHFPEYRMLAKSLALGE
jgi:hypothetical protein